MIYMIVASDKNGLIGKNNSLPWRNSEELAHFKKMTLGHTLLVGRNTFNSLPPNLPNRKIIVLTHSKIPSQTTVTTNELTNLFSKFKNSREILFLAGGKMVYEEFYNQAEIIYHSIISGDYQGDTFINMKYDGYYLFEKISYNTFNLFIYKRNK